MVNKPQVFYNDDSSNLLCAPLCTNSLKWSEGFLGDAMMYDSCCKYEELLRSITLDFDWPKMSIFDLGNGDYSFSTPTRIPRRALTFLPSDVSSFASEEQLSSIYYDLNSLDDKVKELLCGKKKICLNGLCLKELPSHDSLMDTLLPMTFLSRAYNWANNANSGINWSDVISEIWQSNGECMMENKNGEVISLNGLFGTCFGIQPNVSRRNYNFR